MLKDGLLYRRHFIFRPFYKGNQIEPVSPVAPRVTRGKNLAAAGSFPSPPSSSLADARGRDRAMPGRGGGSGEDPLSSRVVGSAQARVAGPECGAGSVRRSKTATPAWRVRVGRRWVVRTPGINGGSFAAARFDQRAATGRLHHGWGKDGDLPTRHGLMAMRRRMPGRRRQAADLVVAFSS